MKFKFIFFCFFSFCNFAKSDTLDLTNEQLVEKFKSGSDVSHLEEALGSAEADKWVDRFLDDARLKSRVYSNIKYIKSENLRSKTLIRYLGDNLFWESAHDSMHDYKGYMAENVCDCIFLIIPELRENKNTRRDLLYSLMSVRGRVAISLLLEKYMNLSAEERSNKGGKAVEIAENLRNVSHKFSSADFNVQGISQKTIGKLPLESPPSDFSKEKEPLITKDENLNNQWKFNFPMTLAFMGLIGLILVGWFRFIKR